MTRDEFESRWVFGDTAMQLELDALIAALIAAAREEQREVDALHMDICGALGYADLIRRQPLTATPQADEIKRLNRLLNVCNEAHAHNVKLVAERAKQADRIAALEREIAQARVMAPHERKLLEGAGGIAKQLNDFAGDLAQLNDLRDLAEAAWGLIANAGGGDWKREAPEWQEAAARWRARYHVDATTPVTPPEGTG